MKRLKDLSIQTKYVMILTLFVGLPVFLLGLWLLHQQVIQQEEMERRNNLNQLRLTAESVDSTMKRLGSIAYEISGDSSVTDLINREPDMQAYVLTKRLLNKMIDSEESIKCIQIFKNGESVFSAGIGTLQTEGESGYFGQLQTGGEYRFWGKAHKMKSYYHGSYEKENLLTPYYCMIYSDGRFTENGVLALYIDEAELFREYQALMTERTEELWLMNSNGDILSSMNKEILGGRCSPEYLPGEGLDSSGISILGSRRSTREYYHSQCDGSDLFLCRVERGDGMIGLEIGYVCLFLLFLFLFIGGCILFHTRFISRPVAVLSREMEACIDEKTEKLKYVTEYDKEDEIGRLTKSSNRMITRINELIDSCYLEQIRSQQAKLDLIGAQINPHFLFNTIDSIHWTALGNGDTDVGEQLEVLSDFLREMLNFGMENITVAQEMSIIDSYCYLIQKRYMSEMHFYKEIDSSLLNCRISKLLIQPLIENAFTHGLEKDLESGSIHLVIREKRKKLQIIVYDDGKGCDGKTVRKEMEGKEGKEYFALRNIRERLRLKYGDEGKLFFYSVPEKGTWVRLELPISRSIG